MVPEILWVNSDVEDPSSLNEGQYGGLVFEELKLELQADVVEIHI